MEKQILAVVSEYEKTGSVDETARNMNLSGGTVRKMLVTAGAWRNRTSVNIAAVRREHPAWTIKQIAQYLKISIKTVQLYSPYEGYQTLAWDEDKTISNNDELVEYGNCGDNATWKLTKGGKLTISGYGPMWNYNSKSWGIETDLHPKWWWRRDGVKVRNIVVEDGITTIGEYAFSELPKLETVTLPDSVFRIEGGVFAGENHLKRIRIPPKVEVISWDTFYLNILLEEVYIPASVYKIQTYAFHACMSLKRLYFEGNAPRVASSSFDLCPEGAITVYYKEEATGFGNLWNGYRTEAYLS